jgi:hypothetical protein
MMGIHTAIQTNKKVTPKLKLGSEWKFFYNLDYFSKLYGSKAILLYWFNSSVDPYIIPI